MMNLKSSKGVKQKWNWPGKLQSELAKKKQKRSEDLWRICGPQLLSLEVSANDWKPNSSRERRNQLKKFRKASKTSKPNKRSCCNRIRKFTIQKKKSVDACFKRRKRSKRWKCKKRKNLSKRLENSKRKSEPVLGNKLSTLLLVCFNN